jgi:uncharacterized membrane protein YkgB
VSTSMREAAAIRRRALILGAFLSVVAIAYIAAFVAAKAVVAFGQETFTPPMVGSSPPLGVYLDVTEIDPVRQSMDVRLDVATGPAAHGTSYFGKLDRDVELQVSDGESAQELRLRRGEPLSSATFVAGLQGAVSRYPFDTYSRTIAVAAVELNSKGERTAIPVRITVWEGVPTWLLRVTKARPAGAAQELALTFTAYRPASHVFFSCVVYGLMVLIAICSVVIGSLTFVGLRRIEVTLVGALTAMVFALPLVRGVLPGSPPLGVLADVLVLLWAEIAVTIGLGLYVTAWALRGPRP